MNTIVEQMKSASDARLITEFAQRPVWIHFNNKDLESVMATLTDSKDGLARFEKKFAYGDAMATGEMLIPWSSIAYIEKVQPDQV